MAGRPGGERRKRNKLGPGTMKIIVPGLVGPHSKSAHCVFWRAVSNKFTLPGKLCCGPMDGRITPQRPALDGWMDGLSRRRRRNGE